MTVRALGEDIKKLLVEQDLQDGTALYYDGFSYVWSPADEDWIKAPEPASTYVETANDDGLTMTFEGVLYELLPDYSPINDLFEKYSLDYEMCHSWALTSFDK